MTGLRNLIAFGRSVTFVLQNLRSITPEFDPWYNAVQEEMKADPLMQYFVLARNELEKQGRLSVGISAAIKSFSTNDIAKFGPPPRGAKGFFIGDQLGGSGWEVELGDGTTAKYYVELPSSVGEVTQQFTNLPQDLSPELKGQSVSDLSKLYIARLRALVDDARSKFLPADAPAKVRGSHLRLVK